MGRTSVSLQESSSLSKWKVLDLAYVLLVLSVIVAMVFVIRLSRQNSSLKSELGRTTGTLCGPQSAERGDLVPAFRTIDLAGREAEVVYVGLNKKSVLFIFS